MKKVFAALAVVSVIFASSAGEARSPWVEARFTLSDSPDLDHRATLWQEAQLLLRERSVFPWEIERVRRSIARAPRFYVEDAEGSAVWVTHLHYTSGCLIGAPIVSSPKCRP